MKNIIVLTILVIIFGVVLTNNSIYCQESPAKPEWKYSFSAGNQFGFVHGQAYEIVYPTPNTTKGELLSELKWDMKPVFYYGASLDFGRRDLSSGPGFFSSVSFKIGVPGDSGTLENRDWMSTENNALTHFSSHTNKTREFYWLDIKAGITIPVKSYFYVMPFINGSWMRFAFTGRDGRGEYARRQGASYLSIENNPRIIYFAGDVITYEQNWLVLAEGLSIGTKYFYPFLFEASIPISPFTYCVAIDEHIERRTTFMDFSAWGIFFEPSFNISFAIQRIELSLGLAYRHIGKTRGETYVRFGDGNFFLSNGEAGAGLSVIDSRFLFRLQL
jgi:outer membrane protease